MKRLIPILALFITAVFASPAFATIAAHAGAPANGTAVATLTSTFTPTTGNEVVCFLNTAVAVTSAAVKDNNANALTVGPVLVSSTTVHMASFYGVAISGATSYIATWTTNSTSSLVCEDYSGSVAVNAGLTTTPNPASGTSATASAVVTTEDSNDWVICGGGDGGNTLTATVGTSRQQVTAGAAGRSLLWDNTSVAAGVTTCTATLTSAAWAMIMIELRTSAGAATVVKRISPGVF